MGQVKSQKRKQQIHLNRLIQTAHLIQIIQVKQVK